MLNNMPNGHNIVSWMDGNKLRTQLVPIETTNVHIVEVNGVQKELADGIRESKENPRCENDTSERESKIQMFFDVTVSTLTQYKTYIGPQGNFEPDFEDEDKSESEDEGKEGDDDKANRYTGSDSWP